MSVVVVMRHPSRRSIRLLRPRPKPRFGLVGSSCSSSSSMTVLWPVKFRNTSSRLGSRSAQPTIGISAASRVRSTSAPALGPSFHRQLDHQVLHQRRLLRQRRQKLGRPRHGVVFVQRHRDHRCAEVGLELGGRPLGDDPTMVDHHDVAGQAVSLFEVLRRQQHRRALAHQLFDGGPEALAALGVQGGGRFVEEEDWWVGHDRGGQVEPTAHAARIGLEPRSPALGEPNASSSSLARRAASAQVGEPAHHVNVFPSGQVLIHRGVLAGQPDDAPAFVGLRHHVMAEHRGGSGSGSRMVERMRTAVVLPAPFGPRRPSTVPAST